MTPPGMNCDASIAMEKPGAGVAHGTAPPGMPYMPAAASML
jgi:hypothetical protein